MNGRTERKAVVLLFRIAVLCQKEGTYFSYFHCVQPFLNVRFCFHMNLLQNPVMRWIWNDFCSSAHWHCSHFCDHFTTSPDYVSGVGWRSGPNVIINLLRDSKKNQKKPKHFSQRPRDYDGRLKKPLKFITFPLQFILQNPSYRRSVLGFILYFKTNVTLPISSGPGLILSWSTYFRLKCLSEYWSSKPWSEMKNGSIAIRAHTASRYSFDGEL